MDNKMLLDLAFDEEKIRVTCEMTFRKTIESLNVSLNKNLQIMSVTDGNHEVKWNKKRVYTPTFREECYEYIIGGNLKLNQLVMTYEGSVNGWCNFIERNAAALNFYSVWYPQELSEPINQIEVCLKQLENYHVVKGVFDQQTKNWHYQWDGFDCNILAFKKGCYKSATFESLGVYYLNPEEEKAIKYIKYYYADIIDYYEKTLFKSHSNQKLDLVSLSLDVYQGAYFREGLIISTNFINSESTEMDLNLKFGSMLAHELAHHWCAGADVDSWEDWLNETTAEWASLLYARHSENSKLFDRILKPKLEEYLDLPAIQSEDESRPIGVHTKGTVLFYFLFEKYGVDVIEKLIEIYVNLNDKTTTAYITDIKQELSDEIASFIEKNLKAQHYVL